MWTLIRGFVLIIVWFSYATPAFSHDARPLFVEINETQMGHFTVGWKFPPTLQPFQYPDITLDGCALGNDTEKASASSKIYICDPAVQESRLVITYPVYNPSLSTLVQITYFGEAASTWLLGPDKTNLVLPKKNQKKSTVFSYYIFGIFHILRGYDHLLFLASLMIIAGSFRRILLVSTGFTIGHSLTIFLVALNLVYVSIAAIEILIVLSIVFVTAEIIRNDRTTISWRHPILIAGIFGLLHGAGFASVLMEIGLPDTAEIPALICFNLGVETGQILAITTVLLTLRLIGKLLPQIDFVACGSIPLAYSIGAMAMYWAAERYYQYYVMMAGQ